MPPLNAKASPSHTSRTARRAASLITLGLLVCLTGLTARAQNAFSSGSTGADGAFAPTAAQTELQVPESGVLNFTTVNIPTGVTVTIKRSLNNKPLTILASGDVLIAGAIILDGKPGNANGSGGAGGAGGYTGGAGGYPFDLSVTGVPGEGPSGGGGGTGVTSSGTPGSGGGGGYGTPGVSGSNASTSVTGGPGGPRFGAVTIVPLLGGSGGGGGGANINNRGGAGGGGGGAILIASSTTISVNGTVSAQGGVGGTGSGGGGGAGGAIRLIANAITGSGTLNVKGGNGGSNFFGFGGGGGGQGYVRVEAFDYGNLTASTVPSNIVSFALPHPVAPTNAPTLRITSVAGVAAPSSPLGSLQGVPDIVVPSTQANPVTVAIEGANLPIGTLASVSIIPARGTRTSVQSSPLAGTEAASTASASVTLPAGMSVVTATATIDLTTASARPLFMDGERVDRIEVAATFGGPSEVTYVTHSGRRIKKASE